MATRRTRPRGQQAAQKPATPATSPEKANATPTGTEPLDGPENPAAGNSAPETTPSDAVPPAGPPEGDAGNVKDGDVPVANGPIQTPPPSETDGDNSDGDDEDDDGPLSEGDLDASEFRQSWLKWCEENNVVLPPGHILFPHEPLTFLGNAVRDNIVMISDDVYRLVLPFRSLRPTFTLVARKGTILPKTSFISKDEYRAAVGDLPVAGMEG